MPPKSKKVIKKAVPAKKKAVASKPKPASRAAPKAAVKKPVTRKTVAAKTVRKAVPKKVAAKKTASQKGPVKKAATKKTVAKKAVTKKVVAQKKTAPKKAAPKKAVVKKSVVKSTPKKTAVKKVAKAAPIKNSAPKSASQANNKKHLAPVAKTAVKPTAKRVSKITPIKAPVQVTPKSTLSVNTKADMSLTNVPPDYEPTDNEEFMSPVMREYFRQRLVAWRDELLRESEETLHILQEEGNMQKPDITDRASEETDLAIEFRIRDRERKLLNKINEAIMRVENGAYGYCEETGDPIPVKRLSARPTVTMTLEAQELHERRERTQRDSYE